ncbi:GNAT family N-acetyltransferase [Hymenobacter cheonanensis]|uniref:GNAT family N-acetyltransferase n=1 Tax=Hymenobacter sp. CA2-7 TaxID=3063993 RepID=UPI002712E032|nr:GNAT family N-acetyltransferase [Hymenobacter sp. CA2-7]MDO7883781.1 GNAT family N-acetyltransferase [Hymenobacter sp. CA2-7]
MPVAFSSPPTWAVYEAESPPGQPPAVPRLPLAFEPFLFLTPAHQALQAHGQPVLAFYLEDPAAGRTVAQLFVVPAPDPAQPGLARSPGQASFGGVQLAPGLPVAALHPLLEATEAALRQRGQQQLEVRSYAFCYDPAGAATEAEALRQRGYEVVLAEQNYHLPTAHDYAAHLRPNERRALRKCHQAGLFLEQEPPLTLPWAYDFMQACRQERQQAPLSLPLERLQAVVRAFPRQHLLLSVREPGGDWAALAVAIQVSSRVLYTFYVASALRLKKLSPALLLYEGLHDFARATGSELLDLGTSTLPGTRQPNVPLLDFKRRLGGVAGLRLTWQKRL